MKSKLLKHIFLGVLTSLSTPIFAQKEANIWYFGETCGLDFNAGPPVALTNGKMPTSEGSAVISDKEGNLLFYTNGENIWNKEHKIMTNGNALKGDMLSTQSALIIPKPESDNVYYVFTVDDHQDNLVDGLHYSEVDMSLSGGLGAVTNNKNIPLVNPSCEKLAATKHANGVDIWVTTQKYNSNEFYSYLVKASGVDATPVISNTAFNINTPNESRGYLKFSPNGKRVAAAYYSGNTLIIGDFDNSTGKISTTSTLSLPAPYGLEFSPSNDFLYVTFNFMTELFQYDLTAADISGSGVSVKKSLQINAIQMGPDKKIYGVQELIPQSLTVINNPDLKGTECDLVQEAVSLENRLTVFGLPNFMSSFFTDSIVEADTVEIVESFFVPNAFSPTGDGINEKFIPQTEKPISEYTMQIYDRWGKMLFQTGDITIGWDGKNNGKLVSVGIYTAKIQYVDGNEKIELVQDLQLIR